MEFRQLLQFYEVCKQGSFSAAGERLYMTQQAVGKSMKQLEEELAVVLFVREKSGVSLTPQGVYLESRCEKLFDFIHETEDQIQLIGANCPLRPKILFPQAGMDELKTNEKVYQEIMNSPILECDMAPEVSEEILSKHNGDVVIRTAPSKDPRHMTYPLLNLTLCTVFQEGDQSVTKREMVLRDFRNRQVIMLETWPETIEKIRTAFREQNIVPAGISFARTMQEGVDKVTAGEGLFIMPERDCSLLDMTGTRVIPIKKRSLSLNLYFISRKQDPCQKEILRVYEFLKVRLLNY